MQLPIWGFFDLFKVKSIPIIVFLPSNLNAGINFFVESYAFTFSIWSISHFYFSLLHLGAAVFCVAPNAVFPFEQYDEEYLEQRDVYLTECQQQLQQFIATYGPGTAIFTSDE